MKILIIEDEMPAACRLQQLIKAERPEAEILPAIESVEEAVKTINGFSDLPDLFFMDIQLADGLSFDIFAQTNITSPVIFTTAYDQYTLKAFKVNSVDYLLKPIDPDELRASLDKYDRLFGKTFHYEPKVIQNLLQNLPQQEYKERFLIKTGQQISFVATPEIRYFYSEDGLVFVRTASGKKHPVDYTLEQLEGLLNPKKFFRINRKAILSIESILKIAPYLNNRLFLETTPAAPFDLIVSRDRVNDFKNWLDR